MSAVPELSPRGILEALPGRPRLVLAAAADSVEWHEARQLGLGGSDIAAALGFDDWRSPLEVYLAKVGEAGPQETSEPMAWGRRLEPVIAAWAAEELGGREIHSPGVLAHAERPWVLGNIDRFVARDDLAVLECKSSRWSERWEEDDLPARVECQARWYLAITGLDVAVVAALLHGSRGILRRIERDERVEAVLMAAGEVFWDRVQRRDPPDPLDADWGARTAVTRALNRTKSVTGLAVDLDERWHDLIVERRDLRRAMGKLEERLSAVDNGLRVAMGDATDAYLDGLEVATWRPVVSHPVDTTALAKAEPEVADRYRTERTTRRLLVHDEPKEPT